MTDRSAASASAGDAIVGYRAFVAVVVAAYFTIIALTPRQSWMPVVSWVRLLPLSALYLALGIWGFDYARRRSRLLVSLAYLLIELLARATLEDDGVRFHFELRNQSDATYDLIWAPIDPRLTSMFHDVRLERTYVHHVDGFDLLASETPSRLTMPLDHWLPARYLASFTWPIPSQPVERRDGITHYNKSRAVDAPFIATLSQDRRWVVASFTRTTGNVWSNPELTCQHVDPPAALSPGEQTILETKILVVRGSLEDVFATAMQQRDSLK